jgi:hypothetical protein
VLQVQPFSNRFPNPVVHREGQDPSPRLPNVAGLGGAIPSATSLSLKFNYQRNRTRRVAHGFLVTGLTTPSHEIRQFSARLVLKNLVVCTGLTSSYSRTEPVATPVELLLTRRSSVPITSRGSVVRDSHSSNNKSKSRSCATLLSPRVLAQVPAPLMCIEGVMTRCVRFTPKIKG